MKQFANVSQDDVRMMREIEQFYSTQIEEMPMFVPPSLIPLLRHADPLFQERRGPYLNYLLNK